MALRAAIQTVLDGLGGSPQLVPDYLIDRVEDLDPEELKNLGIHHIVFDYDNTLARWWAPRPPAAVGDLIRRLLASGITVAVASNGLARRFRRLAESWNGEVRFVGSCRKPDPARLRRLLQDSGWDPQATLVVGDNVMTDVAAGRGAGCVTALVRPISRFEAPPTKLWRLVETVHRARRREWERVTRLGRPTPTPAHSGGVWMQVAVVAAAVLFLAPLLRAPAPGTETSSHQLGLARGFAVGWPEGKPGEPERSLLLMALLSPLRDHATLPLPVAALSLGVMLTGAAMCVRAARPGSGLAVAAVTLPVVFAPACVAATGEVSPAIVELFLTGMALTLPVTPLISGLVFLPSLLNGLSGVVLAPVLIMRAPARSRAPVGGVLAFIGLIAAACWVAALSRPPAPSPGWDQTPAEATVVAASATNGADVPLRGVLAAFEREARLGTLGRSDLGTRLPLVLMAMVFSLPALASRSPGAALYLSLRAAAGFLLPGLFSRDLLLVYLSFGVIAMCTVFRPSPRGIGPALVAALLALAILPDAPDVRRRAASARHSYRKNSELLTLAQAARALPPTASIATPNPALVFLVSFHGTEAPQESGSSRGTHMITPRRDPPAEGCILTRTLMLCPR